MDSWTIYLSHHIRGQLGLCLLHQENFCSSPSRPQKLHKDDLPRSLNLGVHITPHYVIYFQNINMLKYLCITIRSQLSSIIYNFFLTKTDDCKCSLLSANPVWCVSLHALILYNQYRFEKIIHFPSPLSIISFTWCQIENEKVN